MSSEQYVLFDLPSRDPVGAWSLNPWKTRFLLNFKGIDYKTEWLEYPDIKPTLEPHVSANPSTGTWTIPTIKFPDGEYIMDSNNILERVEKDHPEPSVHKDSPVLAKLFSIMPNIMSALRPVYFYTVPNNILSEKSIPYWHETRSKMAGQPIEELHKEKGGQQAWDNAKAHIQEVEALLKENSEGPFFLGKTPSYADFVWGGFLIFMQRNNIIDEVYKISGDSQLHKDLLEATAPWHKRNDH
ncbi:glutathione S-transferase [Fusarium agapanthi]|uniref:Glutathione S-transferase n=1 Tax=Fusarium agapanthi TaxID=1803897 RepID=A0A9P5B5H3_9HYPO|nr:glutathione S-transferase [Fusarium agapanthi]